MDIPDLWLLREIHGVIQLDRLLFAKNEKAAQRRLLSSVSKEDQQLPEISSSLACSAILAIWARM